MLAGNNCGPLAAALKQPALATQVKFTLNPFSTMTADTSSHENLVNIAPKKVESLFLAGGGWTGFFRWWLSVCCGWSKDSLRKDRA